MKVIPLALEGAALLEPAKYVDDRGYFMRTYCGEELAKHGISIGIVQCSISYNRAARTLRGLHFQKAPFSEDKVVRCVKGDIFDVIVDIRQQSPTLGRWLGVRLTGENALSLLVPQGFAHGFITLTDRTEVQYMMSTPFNPVSSRGIRWDDPLIGIEWPNSPAVISERDNSYPFLPSLEPWLL